MAASRALALDNGRRSLRDLSRQVWSLLSGGFAQAGLTALGASPGMLARVSAANFILDTLFGGNSLAVYPGHKGASLGCRIAVWGTIFIAICFFDLSVEMKLLLILCGNDYGCGAALRPDVRANCAGPFLVGGTGRTAPELAIGFSPTLRSPGRSLLVAAQGRPRFFRRLSLLLLGGCASVSCSLGTCRPFAMRIGWNMQRALNRRRRGQW